MSFPRLYAAASLKRCGVSLRPLTGEICFPRLYAAASLKPELRHTFLRSGHLFSAALCRGLIEAREGGRQEAAAPCRFPRLYAAASLKLVPLIRGGPLVESFSAALCRGLIEAPPYVQAAIDSTESFPRLYAAASLKRLLGRSGRRRLRAVFRGFMPRPH